MRLTLRTMLAYLDDVLEPADAEALRKKIEESDFASGLVDRIRGALKKLRMDAPKLDGKGMGNDANTVAEYLDSALTQDRVAEFERVCLESDKHLCEVASCHQILTIVLGKPADVPADLRERIYALGDPERAAAQQAAAAATATRSPAVPPPVVKPSGNGQPAPRAAPLEVPEYLRSNRSLGVWPLVGMTAVALLLSLLVLHALGAFDKNGPLARLFGRDQMIADVEPNELQDHDDATFNTDVDPPANKSGKTDKSGKSGDGAGSAVVVIPETTKTAPSPVSPAVPAAAPPAPQVAAADVPPVESPASTLPPPPAISAAPAATDIAVATVPSVPAAPVTTPKLPQPKAPVVATPARPRPADVGRFSSDSQLLATFDSEANLWYAKQPQQILSAGERLVVLPPYRPQITLPSAVQLTFAGEGALRMEEPEENRMSGVIVEYGRFLAATAGKPGAQVQLDLAGIKGVLTLVDADSKLAIKAIRWLPPGVDPELSPGMPVIEMYNENGRVTWEQADQPKVEIPARYVHVYVGDDPAETHGPFFSPEWIDARNVKPIDREASLLVEKMLDPERPLSLSLQEAMKDRRVEVRALAARCLSALGDFEPVLRELGDPTQYSFWQGEFDALRQALSRSPDTATKIRETVNLTRAADAKDIYRMLWGYSEDQLAKGASAQLVKYLEHDQLDVRVLAYVNLVSITGMFGAYRPERAPAQMKTAIADWSKRKDKGAIVYKMPPSPLDTYKPIAAAPEAKAGASKNP